MGLKIIETCAIKDGMNRALPSGRDRITAIRLVSMYSPNHAVEHDAWRKDRMKSMLTTSLLAICGLLIFGCKNTCRVDAKTTYQDGVYRGIFIDGDSIQINVQFKLEGGVVTEASFRHLRRDEDYHLTAETEPYRSVIQQYSEALNHLIGKHLENHLADLYTPEAIVVTEVDGYTAATLRSNKIISAIRDALNRGVYSY